MSIFSGLSSLGQWLRPAPPVAGPVQDALHRAAAALGGQMQNDAQFQRRLQRPVAHALDYCDSLADAVPGTIDIDRSAFASNPLVHALFASPGDIDTMLGRSLDLRNYLEHSPSGSDNKSGEHLYSMLAMRRKEKPTMGMELDGNTLRSDVPQTLLYFADHTLVDLASSLEATRAQLRLAAFDSLMACFTGHLESVRTERKRLRDHRAMESAHLTMVRGNASGQDIAVHTRQITELDARLQSVAESLQPGPVVDALAEFLASPETSLRLEPIEVCVDRSGVIRDGKAAAEGKADTIGFPELIARDQRRHVVVLARIRREDAERAVAAIRDQQARFIVI